MLPLFQVFIVIEALTISVSSTHATHPVSEFEQRQSDFIDFNLDNPDETGFGKIVLQAKRGQNLTQNLLINSIQTAVSSPTGDFRLIELVRVLFYTQDYNDQILNGITSMSPFWVRLGDNLYNYWTENHMIIWSSSAYLLKQKFPNDPRISVDINLEQRLFTYLNLKIFYGYFEVNSAIYFPYTMSALLNLADFAQDKDIRKLAIDALEVLLSQVIENTNNQCSFYPSQTRSQQGRWNQDPFNGDITNNLKVIYLLTGIIPNNNHHLIPFSLSDGSSILAVTNSKNVQNLLNKYQERYSSLIRVNGPPVRYKSVSNTNVFNKI